MERIRTLTIWHAMCEHVGKHVADHMSVLSRRALTARTVDDREGTGHKPQFGRVAIHEHSIIIDGQTRFEMCL